jgi:CRISPR/Cas system-associated exonuclease Cas4 (RecB family)
VKTQEEADRRIKESTQMMMYALSWYQNYKIIPKTTLYFIESGLKGERYFDLEALNKTKTLILGVISGIKNNEMIAKPEMFSCKYCPYRSICPNSIS